MNYTIPSVFTCQNVDNVCLIYHYADSELVKCNKDCFHLLNLMFSGVQEFLY